MRIPRFSTAVLLASLASLLASCGPDLQVVKADVSRYSGSGSSKWLSTGERYSPDHPSASVIAEGSRYSKDKHGMPLYNRERTRHVRTTAYTCTEADHLQYGSMNATGTPLKYSGRVRSAAADWSVYPVGTVFRIKGMPQLYVVDDYGSALTGTGTVDLYKPSHGHMNAWGRRNVELTIVQWGSYARSAELLSKRTHHAHCREMYVNIQRKLGNGARTAAR